MRSTIFLVRHAQSVSPTPNGPNEYLRPLTDIGRAQANQLAGSLAELDPSAVISSPYLRSVQPSNLRPGNGTYGPTPTRGYECATPALPSATAEAMASTSRISRNFMRFNATPKPRRC
ncbi:SixA phosphatase family protein [Nocardia carnea]|uniref:SixA phosphatase family protein n=1 Tax=Nocardia carnea TaxID=37328 RepID=UPI003D7B4BAA